MSKDRELENLFNKWNEIKQEIKNLEKKEEKIKRIFQDIMLDRNVNVLQTSEWKVTKRSQNIPRLLKKDVPTDIWKRYSTVSSFDALYLSKNKSESMNLKNR